MNPRFVPWVAFILGAAASIAANVAHAAERAEQIGAGAMLAAAWAPVALLLVAEMVTRGTRPTGITAVIQWSGTAVVAAVAAVVSYGHMRDLLLGYGETDLVAHILPLSVDGLLLVASVALGRGRGQQRPAEATAPANSREGAAGRLRRAGARGARCRTRGARRGDSASGPNRGAAGCCASTGRTDRRNRPRSDGASAARPVLAGGGGTGRPAGDRTTHGGAAAGR